MAYRFKRRESIREGVARIFQERTDKTLLLLGGTVDLDSGIHGARKNIKQLRSLLRLIGSEFPPDQYQKANHHLRSLGQSLSDVRDAKVMVDTFEHLQSLYPNQAKKHDVGGLGASLRARLQTGEAGGGRAIQQARAVFDDMSNGPDLELGTSLDTHEFTVLERGFTRAYRGGRKAMKRAMRESGPEDFHIWRKRVKDHWYHTLLLRKCWPKFLRPRRDQLKDLSELLGDYNDLSVLRAFCEAELQSQQDNRFRALARLAKKRQQVHRANAARLGKRIYQQRPDELQTVMAEHWGHWKRGK